MDEMVLVNDATMRAISRGEYRPLDWYTYSVIMLANESTLRAYSIGLNWGINRIREAREILVNGRAARYWTSTRLLLGLSEDEAIQAGKLLA